jgi:hypothetical protein
MFQKPGIIPAGGSIETMSIVTGETTEYIAGCGRNNCFDWFDVE